MSEMGLAAKQKSSIIMDAGGIYLKSAALDKNRTPRDWTNIVESIDILNPKKQQKTCMPMDK